MRYAVIGIIPAIPTGLSPILLGLCSSVVLFGLSAILFLHFASVRRVFLFSRIKNYILSGVSRNS